MNLSPTLKGLITGLLMVGAVLIIHYTGKAINSHLEYSVYALYTGGIAWTLLGFIKSNTNTLTFTGLFSQGFRCFIAVTLVMVVFWIVFIKLHPEFAEEDTAYKREQIEKVKGKTTEDIDKVIADIKAQLDSFDKKNQKIPKEIEDRLNDAEYQKQILAEIKNKTPDDIEKALIEGKRQFAIRFISGSIFGYLLIGVLLTTTISGILLIIRRNQ